MAPSEVERLTIARDFFGFNIMFNVIYTHIEERYTVKIRRVDVSFHPVN